MLEPCFVMCVFESSLVSQSSSFGCAVAVSVLCVCLTVPSFVLCTAIVVFPGHTCNCFGCVVAISVL